MSLSRHSLILLLAYCALGTIPLMAQTKAELSEELVLRMAEENVENYRKGDALLLITDTEGKPVPGVELQIRQKSHHFLFGALMFDLVNQEFKPAEEALFKERFSELFNLAIFPFYWGAYEPVAGHPRWDRMEPVLDWCLENGITCKGHPLAWTHEIGLPDYVLDLSLEESEVLLESRIIENVKGFKDRITLWDVVNEPVNTVSWTMAHQDKSKKNRYRTDIPLEQLTGWVGKAYETAYRANPDNQYILNEFRQIADPGIRARFYDFTRILLERQIPVSGLGIQAHEPRADWFDPVEVWKTLDQYATFDLPLHITEFIPQSAGADITGGYRTGQWTPETQAEYAETMYRIWFGHPSVASINWWGFSDRNAWLPGGGFLDENMEPKPVFQALKRLIKDEWMTHDFVAVTDRKGACSFRGFYGEYEVQATLKDGTTRMVPFTFEKATQKLQKVKIQLN